MTPPRIGQHCILCGVACRIVQILPASTVLVEALDGTGRQWQISGLGF